MLATLLSSLLDDIILIIDSIFVGNFIGHEAVAAINIFRPIIFVYFLLYNLLATGAFVLYSKFIGERSFKKINTTLSCSLISLMLVWVVSIFVSSTFGKSFFGLFCKDAQVLDYFLDYAITTSIFTIGFIYLKNFFASTLTVNGKPQFAIYSIFILGISNLLFDYLFICKFNWGMRGAALASTFSYIICIIYQIYYIRHEFKSLMNSLIKKFSFKPIKSIFECGLSKTISGISVVIVSFFLNFFIQDHFGSEDFYVWSIFSTILAFAILVAESVGFSSLSIAQFYKGQSDIKGLRFIVNRSFKIMIGVILLLLITLELFSGELINIFGSISTEVFESAKEVFRYCTLILPGALLTIYISNIYDIQGYLVKSISVLFCYPAVVVISSFFILKVTSTEYLWWLFPLSGALLLIVIFILSGVTSFRNRSLKFITLIPKKDNDISYDISIKANEDEFKKALTSLSDYLKSQGMDPSLVFKVNICIEEIMINIVQNSGAKMDNHFFDVHISVLDNKVVASVKDDNRAFNPTHIPEEQRGLGLTILYALCESINYEYMFGQNMTYLTWEMN